MALQMLHDGKVDSMQDAVNSEVLFGDPASTGVMSQDGCDLRGQADSALPEPAQKNSHVTALDLKPL